MGLTLKIPTHRLHEAKSRVGCSCEALVPFTKVQACIVSIHVLVIICDLTVVSLEKKAPKFWDCLIMAMILHSAS